MKFLGLLVLAVIGAQAAVVESPARANLSVGVIGSADWLMHSSTQTRRAVANAIQSHNVTFRAVAGRRVTAVRAEELGGTQRATARIISGGIGQSFVIIRFQSIRSGGYNYGLRIWGR